MQLDEYWARRPQLIIIELNIQIFVYQISYVVQFQD